MRRVVTRLTSRAETHEQLTVRAELVDLVALCAFRVTREVCSPHGAVVIHINAMWCHEHTDPKVR